MGIVRVLSEYQISYSGGTRNVVLEFFFDDDGGFYPVIRYRDTGGQTLQCVPFFVDWDVAGFTNNYAEYYMGGWYQNHYEFALEGVLPCDANGFSLRLGKKSYDPKVYCGPDSADIPVQFVTQLSGVMTERHPVQSIIYPRNTDGNDNAYFLMIRGFDSGEEHSPQYVVTLDDSSPLRSVRSPLSGEKASADGSGLSILAEPNPLGGETTISYRLPAESHVVLRIYDVKGALVRTIVDAPQSQGSHSVIWDGNDGNGNAASPGVYFSRLEAGDVSGVSKMIVLR